MCELLIILSSCLKCDYRIMRCLNPEVSVVEYYHLMLIIIQKEMLDMTNTDVLNKQIDWH